MNQLNYEEYLDKVRGCWAGKNIGGTLGAPMEGDKNVQNVSFYTQELNGVPAPNDDLDLQLIWLAAVEILGIDQITPRRLGEFWDQSIIAPCSEYSICKMNIANGFLPPLSGAVNNNTYRYSNGAWIRSEIWACLCPGAPDEAIRYGYIDSCADHSGEGIWAEMFTTALQSAAFVESDFRKLIEIALSKVPADSQLALAVKRAVQCHDEKKSWLEARNALMAEFDIDKYRAAVNIGFVIIGLLYGEGDFDKSLCTAVNCGDDTDCTGATVGALFGIVKGRKGIPQRWLEPIGESISTICINHFAFVFLYGLPKTLEELSRRTAQAALKAAAVNPFLARITDGPTQCEADAAAKLVSTEAAKRLLALPEYYQDYELPFVIVRAEYPDGPEALPGETLELKLSLAETIQVNGVFTLRWKDLPAEWSAEPQTMELCVRSDCRTAVSTRLKVGAMPDTVTGLTLEVTMTGRRFPQLITIPVQRRNSVQYRISGESDQSYRCRTRIVEAAADRPAAAMPQL